MHLAWLWKNGHLISSHWFHWLCCVFEKPPPEGDLEAWLSTPFFSPPPPPAPSAVLCFLLPLLLPPKGFELFYYYFTEIYSLPHIAPVLLFSCLMSLSLNFARTQTAPSPPQPTAPPLHHSSSSCVLTLSSPTVNSSFLFFLLLLHLNTLHPHQPIFFFLLSIAFDGCLLLGYFFFVSLPSSSRRPSV